MRRPAARRRAYNFIADWAESNVQHGCVADVFGDDTPETQMVEEEIRKITNKLFERGYG